MLLERPLTIYDVDVILLWSIMVVVNPESVETCKRYDAAPDDTFQLRSRLVATPVAPFMGLVNTGGNGGATIVVKFQLDEYELVPPAFAALTCQ